MAVKKQNYGIKFPFTINNDKGIFVDVNEKYDDKISSEIAHVILTPKNTRIRMPEFGTNLIKYLFDANDDMMWENIKSEIREAVGKYVPNASIDDVNILMKEDDSETAFVDIEYSVLKGNTQTNNRMVIKL